MYQQPTGINYYHYFKALHEQHILDWYMEIGCRRGEALANVRGKSIAVDPFFRMETNVINAKPAFFAFQETSDDFFANGYLEKLGVKLSLSFLDGMHLFEYLLRDFINTEKNSDPNGAIILHDCWPFTPDMTTRNLDEVVEGMMWTGDVWKLVPILQTHRPDLNIEIVDASPTGLVIVTGLKPDNQVLSKHYDSIFQEWQSVEFTEERAREFHESFKFVSAGTHMDQGFKYLDAVSISPNDSKTPAYITP